MSDAPFKYRIGDWTFRIDASAEKPVPWVYKNVRHDGCYNFAKEVSIEKIIVEVKEYGEKKTYSLKASDFVGLSGEELAGFKEYNPKTNAYTMGVANFSVYKGRGLLLAMKTKKDVLLANSVDGKPVDEPLYLFFTILFGDYGVNPPHEFTGVLQAARFTPALRFETKNDSVRSVRVHYRFHFDLDSYLKKADEQTKQKAKEKGAVRGPENYVSLLRDADQFPPSLIDAIKLLKDVFGVSADMSFFQMQLDACNYGWGCRLSTESVMLEISDAGAPSGDGLNVSFLDPRTTPAYGPEALRKSTVSLTDKDVGALSVGGADEYNPSVVDELAAKVFDKVVGPTKLAQGLDAFGGKMWFGPGEDPLPGVSAACLMSSVKYRLVQLVISNYRARKAASLLKQLSLVKEEAVKDLADILKYLKPGDFDKVLKDIAGMIRGVLEESPVPFVGLISSLKTLAELAESVQGLAGKLISIAGFACAEKPVLYEVVGTFVRAGDVKDTWDNLHCWGTEFIPSAPGAFHAAHSHFRWSQLNTYPTAEAEAFLDVGNAVAGSKAALHNRAPQLRSLVKRFADNGLSGPLIDPNIPDQTISVALALNGGELDKKLLDRASKESDEIPFDEVRASAQEIARVGESGNEGKDIVYWLSCKAVRTRADAFKGTLLVNGFYFAHDEEKPFSLFAPANLFAFTQGVALQKPEREKPIPLHRDPSAG